MTQKYHILYNLSAKTGDFTESDLEMYSKDDSICDAYVFVPIRYRPDVNEKAFVFDMDSLNGLSGNPLTAKELFNFWAALGILISKKNDLTIKQREILKWPADCFNLYTEVSK